MASPLDDLAPPSSNPLDALAPPSASTQTQYQITAPYDSALGATRPVTAELSQGLQNARIGVGSMYTDAAQRMHQLYNFIRGGPSMDAEIMEKRATDKQINNTYGGNIGRTVAVAPGALLTGPAIGANALYGGVLGALQPTTSKDFGGNLGATGTNVAIGTTLSAGSAAIGKWLAGWAPHRSQYPLMGWTPESADRTLAGAVGSTAPRLDQAALGTRAAELSSIFNTGRSAATSIDLAATPGRIDRIIAELNPSVRTLVEANPNVSDLMSHATGIGTVNGQALGRISTGLRQDASAALNSEGGNREVGLALQRLREHVEDTIQSNIADPSVRAAYAAARPQYGLLQDVRYSPPLLNAATGRANMEALGKYLQRNNPAYTTENAMDNPLFNAATWGQRGGGAKGAPSFNLGAPWRLPFYGVTHNPVARAAGGVVSRVVAPIAPAIPYGLAGLGAGSGPVLLPYLEQ